MRFAAALLLVQLVQLGASTAEAQWVHPPPSTANQPEHVVFGQMSIYGGGLGPADWTSLSWRLGGFFRPIDALELGFVWGFAFNDYEAPVLAGGEQSAFMPGNPYFQVAYRHLFRSSNVLLRVGGGVAVPVASVDPADSNTISQGLALLHSISMHAGQDAWLFANDTVSLVLPTLRVDGHVGAFVWGADTAVAIAIPTDDGSDTEVLHQLGAEAGGRFAEILVAGGRLSFLFVLTAEDPQDAAQIALEPFFRVDANRGFFELRLTMNLDNPAGFAFDDGKVWAVHLGGGGRF